MALTFDDGPDARYTPRILDVLGTHGITPVWYRPPRKRHTEVQHILTAARGMRAALWTRTLERSRFRSPTEAAVTLVRETRSGDIVLAHDGGLDRSATVAALPAYLDGLRSRRLAVVTVSELEALHRSERSARANLGARLRRALPRSLSR